MIEMSPRTCAATATATAATAAATAITAAGGGARAARRAVSAWTAAFASVASVLLAGLIAATPAAAAEQLVVGATQVPHAEILEYVKPALAKEGVDLKIVVFSDYVQPNLQLADKQLDLNFFQHQPYLDTFNKDRRTQLVSIAKIHVEPFGAYSRKVKNIYELKTGATVAIPNDPTNGGRALLLLQKQGLIKLKNPNAITATPLDVTDNPKKLKFKELEAAMLPRSLDDVELALINTNYALQAGLVPTQDALFIEESDSPYANVLVARPDNQNKPAVRQLVKALQTPEVKQFIQEKYKGAIVPAF